MRGDRAMLGMLLVASMVLAGCAGGAANDQEGGSEVVNQKIVKNEPKAGQSVDVEDVGYVHGTVLTPAGFPVPDALVLILAVEHSVTTNGNGTFLFDEVPVGAHTMRIEEEHFKTLVKEIEVEAGATTHLEVVMAPLDGVTPDQLAHFHNHWGLGTTYTVFDETAEWVTELGDPPMQCNGVIGGSVALDYRECHYLDLIVPEGVIVPPGTKELSFEVSFEAPQYPSGGTIYLQVRPPPPPKDYQYIHSTYLSWPLAVGTNEITLEIDPLATDNGHSASTDWDFMIYWRATAPGYGASLPNGAIVNEMFKSPITATITAHKGQLEMEPPHPKFWAESNTITSESTKSMYVLCIGCTDVPRSPAHPYRYACNYACSRLDADIVPPGTTHINFTFAWWLQGTEPVTEVVWGALYDRDYRIGFKTADPGRGSGTWDDWEWPTPDTRTPYEGHLGEVHTFSVPIDASDADSHYARLSQWTFQLAEYGNEEAERLDTDCPYTLGYTCYLYSRITNIAFYNADRDAEADGA